VSVSALQSEFQRAEGTERCFSGNTPTCVGTFQKPPVRPSVMRPWRGASEPGRLMREEFPLLFCPGFLPTVGLTSDSLHWEFPVRTRTRVLLSGVQRGSRSSSWKKKLGFQAPFPLDLPRTVTHDSFSSQCFPAIETFFSLYSTCRCRRCPSS
jgi:hypothetical protein